MFLTFCIVSTLLYYVKLLKDTLLTTSCDISTECIYILSFCGKGLRKLADAAVFRSSKCGGSGKSFAWRGCATHRAFQCDPVEFRDALKRSVLAPTASYEEHALARAPCNCGQRPAITGHVTHSPDCKRIVNKLTLHL
jgi:hypothetical protein